MLKVGDLVYQIISRFNPIYRVEKIVDERNITLIVIADTKRPNSIGSFVHNVPVRWFTKCSRVVPIARRTNIKGG